MTTTTTTAIKSTPAPAAQRWAPRPSPFFPVPEVQWDAESGEPYLAIEGHPDLHLTPFHDTQEDAEALTANVRVGYWNRGAPFPGTVADSQSRLLEVCPAQLEAVAALRADPGATVSILPFTVIRDAATGLYVGEAGVWAGGVNTPDVWKLAYSVSPTLQGKGIATAAVKTVLGYAAKAMGVRKVEATIDAANVASCKLVEKLGFSAAEVRKFTWNPAKGGDEREAAIFQREFGPPVSLNPAPPFPVPEVKWDGGEPYLQPRPDVILTPYRDTPRDVKELMELCNEHEVGKWSHNRAYPFEEKHARKRFDGSIPPQTVAVAALRADPNAVVEVMPFTVIREATTGRYIGDTVLRFEGSGEERVAWLAYGLHPKFHGRGIAAAVVGAMLGWSKQGMGATKVQATAETTNPGSNGLLRKLGFTNVETKWVKFPEDKGGQWREAGDWLRDL